MLSSQCTYLLAASCAQDSLLRLKDHQQCFECSEISLNEAVQQMVNSSEAAAKEEWVATVTQLLLGIEQTLSADNSGSILKESSSTTGLVRLTNNLIQVTPGSSPCPAPAGEWLCFTQHPNGTRYEERGQACRQGFLIVVQNGYSQGSGNGGERQKD